MPQAAQLARLFWIEIVEHEVLGRQIPFGEQGGVIIFPGAHIGGAAGIFVLLVRLNGPFTRGGGSVERV